MELWNKLRNNIYVKVFYPVLRKFTKMITAEIEANYFKDRFQEEVKKRCELEEEIMRGKEKHYQEVSKATREAMRRAVNISFEVIREEYDLVPKKSTSFQDALQGNLLGQTPPLRQIK